MGVFNFMQTVSLQELRRQFARNSEAYFLGKKELFQNVICQNVYQACWTLSGYNLEVCCWYSELFIVPDRALSFNWKILIFVLFLHKNICCGYSLEAPQWGTSNEYPQYMFLCRNKKTFMWLLPLIWSCACTCWTFMSHIVLSSNEFRLFFRWWFDVACGLFLLCLLLFNFSLSFSFHCFFS